MSSERHDVVVYDNVELRDQWEQRAQSDLKTLQQENKRKEDSALNGLFKQWQYRLAQRTGAAPAADKKKGDLSDFRKYVVMSSGDSGETDTSHLEVKFKVVAPPKIIKRAQSPPAKKKPPPQPRKERPKPVEKKPEPPKKPNAAPSSAARPGAPQAKKGAQSKPTLAAPKQNLSAGWEQSWMCLKPEVPHQQQDDPETGDTDADTEVHRDRKYKSPGCEFDSEWESGQEWAESWKQVKKPVQEELQTQGKSQWEVLSRGKWWRKFSGMETFSLPEWAGTWKNIMMDLGQKQEDWDQEWPRLEQEHIDKLLKAEPLNEQVSLPGWEDSWKCSKDEAKQQDDEERMLKVERMPNVFLPGWRDSWMVSRRAPLEDDQPCLKDWGGSWSCCQEHKWCKASMESRHLHHEMLMWKRRRTNEVLSSDLDEEMASSSEWLESWMSPKPQSESEETQEGEEEELVNDEEENVEEGFDAKVPLHLQFYKINTPMSDWCEAWKVSKAHSASGAGKELKTNTAWNDSWKLSNANVSSDAQDQEDVVYMSTKHRSRWYVGLQHTEEAMDQEEWSEAWKSTKRPDLEDTTQQQQQQQQQLSQEEVTQSERDFFRLTSLVKDVPLYDWRESWKFHLDFSPSCSYSLAHWRQSWRLSIPQNHLDRSDSQTHPHNGPKHHRHLYEVELPQEEWKNGSWKYLTSDAPLDPGTPREEGGEWGECWRVLNPQLYMKKEAWCEGQAQSEEETKELHLQLSFLSKGDLTKEDINLLLNPDLCVSEWNDSWKLLKQDTDPREV